MQYLYIFIGGGIGALSRFALASLNNHHALPLGTFSANMLGAFLMGLLSALSIQFFRAHPHIKKGLTTGFLGALTTFSTFQFELVTFFHNGAYILLLTYAVSSYIIGLACCYVGFKLGGRRV